MKRDREEEEPQFGGPEPRWVKALVDCADTAKPLFHDLLRDDSLEWDRYAYSPRLFGGQRNVGNKMLPLGFMIKEWMWPWVDEFVTTLNIDIRAPCAWLDNVPYTPVEWAMRLDVLCDIWVETFWRAGVRAADIPCRIHPSGKEDYMSRAQITNCMHIEDGIMAMVWCCAHVTGTTWRDNSETIAERMRRIKCADWVDVRNELDYQLCLLHDSDFEDI